MGTFIRNFFLSPNMKSVIKKIFNTKKKKKRASLVAQWLRLHTSTAGGAGSIPGRGTKISHAVQHSQKILKKKRKKQKQMR